MAMTIYTHKPTAQGMLIVPMLDILTILLIFFIAHTEFKRQVQVLPMNLPQTQHLAGEKGDRDSILLEVGDDGSLALKGQVVEASALEQSVRELLKKSPGARLQVAAAEGASLGRFIEVIDLLTAAGLQAEQIPVRIHHTP